MRRSNTTPSDDANDLYTQANTHLEDARETAECGIDDGDNDDLQEAFRLYQQAADLGHTPSMTKLGKLYLRSSDDELIDKGVELLDKAISNNDKEAMLIRAVAIYEAALEGDYDDGGHEKIDKATSLIDQAIQLGLRIRQQDAANLLKDELAQLQRKNDARAQECSSQASEIFNSNNGQVDYFKAINLLHEASIRSRSFVMNTDTISAVTAFLQNLKDDLKNQQDGNTSSIWHSVFSLASVKKLLDKPLPDTPCDLIDHAQTVCDNLQCCDSPNAKSIIASYTAKTTHMLQK